MVAGCRAGQSNHVSEFDIEFPRIALSWAASTGSISGAQITTTLHVLGRFAMRAEFVIL
jgi:hypothetical protein